MSSGVRLALKQAGRKLRTARRNQTAALKDARLVALEALAEGVTEVEVAELLGVDRMTVRKWNGKR